MCFSSIGFESRRAHSRLFLQLVLESRQRIERLQWRQAQVSHVRHRDTFLPAGAAEMCEFGNVHDGLPYGKRKFMVQFIVFRVPRGSGCVCHNRLAHLCPWNLLPKEVQAVAGEIHEF